MAPRSSVLALAFVSAAIALAGVAGSALADDDLDGDGHEESFPSRGLSKKPILLSSGQNGAGQFLYLLATGTGDFQVMFGSAKGMRELEVVSIQRESNRFRVDTLELGLAFFHTGLAEGDGVVIPGDIGFGLNKSSRPTMVFDQPIDHETLSAAMRSALAAAKPVSASVETAPVKVEVAPWPAGPHAWIVKPSSGTTARSPQRTTTARSPRTTAARGH